MSSSRSLVLAAITLLVCGLLGAASVTSSAARTPGGGSAAGASDARTASGATAQRTTPQVRKARARKKRVCSRARTLQRRQAGTRRAQQARQRCRQAKRKLSRARERAKARPGTPPVQRTGFTEYVSLGDSWSADVVFFDLNGSPATEHVPVDCAQSQVNYPKLVARELGIPVHRDATCGSATTTHFAGPQSLPLGGTNPPQYDRLSPTTDLVTIGIGGNDAGFASAAIGCLDITNGLVPPVLPPLPISLPILGSELPIGECKARFVTGGRDLLAEQIAASKPKLVAAIRDVRRRAPNARILMLDYIAGIPEQGCYPLVPITDTDMAYLHATFAKLNAMVRAAAAEGGAEFVDTHTPTLGRDVCQSPTVRYVEGLGIVSLNGVAVAVPAHPNSAGAAAQAEIVLDHIATKG